MHRIQQRYSFTARFCTDESRNGLCVAMWCIAVCCSVLQCYVLQCVAVFCSVVYCSVLQRVAACCSKLKCGVLQCVVVCCSVVCCSVLQCIAVCCRVLHVFTARFCSAESQNGRMAKPYAMLCKLQVSFRKTAVNYRALCQKETCFTAISSCTDESRNGHQNETKYRVAKTHRMPELQVIFAQKSR